MNLNRIAVVMAVAFAFANEATAATVCVQNKSTGLYEPKTPTTENAGDCSSMNKAATAAIVEQVLPGPVVRPAVAAATGATTPTTPPAADARTVAPVVLPQSNTPIAAQKIDLAKEVRTYRLQTSDLSVRLALSRWLKEVKMQLAYEAAEEFAATVEADYTGTMPEVLLDLMTSLKQSKYPLRACEYNNRVVLIVHRNDLCPLEDE